MSPTMSPRSPVARSPILTNERRRYGDPRGRRQTPDPAAHDRERRTKPVRHRPGLELAQLRSAHEKDHVDAGHAPTQVIRRLQLSDDVSNDRAHGIRGAGERQAQKSQPERSGQAEDYRREPINAD